MDIIKRKISFEPATVRYTGGTAPYGTMTADSFYIKIMLTQNIDNMGVYTDVDFIPESSATTNQPDYTILQNKLAQSGITFPFMTGQQPVSGTPIDQTTLRVTGKGLEDYWAYGDTITGFTDTKIKDVTSYDQNNPYIVGFDINTETYTGYTGLSIDGRTRVTQLNQPKFPYNNSVESALTTTYVFDTNNDVNIGTENQTTGLLYRDFSGITRAVVDFEYNTVRTIGLTDLKYTGEGWNETNTSLSAITKEEYLFGITQTPEVDSDVFIDRGSTIVFEKHLRLSEVESLEHLERYNNGYYNLNKQ